MSVASAVNLPSSRRPIPLTGRDDLRVQRIEYQGTADWVIKDPIALKYHRLQAPQYHVFNLLDGRLSLEEIRRELSSEFPTLNFRLIDVQHIVADLHEKGLLLSSRPGRAPFRLQQHRKQRRRERFSKLRNLLYIKLPGWDPERTLEWLLPLTRWMFRPWAAVLAIVLVASSLILLAVQFDHFRSRLPEFQQFFGWPNLVYLWFTLAAAKIVHEFAHGLSCKHYGGECHEMGVMLLVFTPSLYCDVSDSWMLSSKWKRIFIGGAGMYAEVVISAIAIFAWWYTQPGLLNHLALNVFFVTAVTTVIFNANPLMRFDGYFMLSDLLEIPNLRPKSDHMLREKFAWYCLGIEMPPDPFMPQRGRGWFVLYSVAAALYRWFVLFGITLFLYTVLKPYGLQSIGITMAVVSLATVVGNLIFSVYRMIAAPRSTPMSKTKVGTTLAVVACVLIAALAVPLPLHVEAPFTLEPHQVQHVYAKTPGRLVELRVQPGQTVKSAGNDSVLVRLTNHEKEDEYRQLTVQRDMQQIEVEVNRALDDSARRQLAAEKLQSLEEQLAELRQQLEDLVIVAPVAGTIVAPPRVDEPRLDRDIKGLHAWFGTPLDSKNLGCWVEAGTHLFSIAPVERLDAKLLADQGDGDDLEVGQTVELKLDHLPDEIFVGKIERISQRQVDFAPVALSNKMGGELATVSDSRGRERLTSSAYQATVALDTDADLLRPGMRGRARFVADKRSALSWVWRSLRRTFRFRL